MRILVAEDDPVSALVLRKTLEKRGYCVMVVSNGAEAMKLLEAEDFRLLILDWMMPAIDGLEVCRRLRAKKEEAYRYVIFLTAKQTREDRLEALEGGADDFLSKPLDPVELMARIRVAERILDMQEQLQARARELEALHQELVTQHNQLKEAMVFLQGANRRFTELFMGLPIACCTYDIDGGIHEWNRACETLFGLSAEEVFEKKIWEVIGRPEDEAETRERVSRVFAGERFEGLEMEDRRPDGTVRYLLCSTFPLSNADRWIVGAISAYVDITERKLLEEQVQLQVLQLHEYNVQLELQKAQLQAVNAKLESLATTDGLTGLKNHRYFVDVLEDAFVSPIHRSGSCSLILLDVDKFKEYNDTYGHPAGDEVLRTVADILTRNAREKDIVARYGGEEFVVLLPETSAEAAIRVAERFRKAIEKHPWPLRPVTASFGVTTVHNRNVSTSQLVSEADEALYHSKSTGRNRTTHFQQLRGTECSSPLLRL
ncbi:MAG TPA: diguanylate cyclase [Chthonomonadales bacterium]|nr:diguanylate cyclase [Chthonomonadales bacterium]